MKSIFFMLFILLSCRLSADPISEKLKNAIHQCTLVSAEDPLCNNAQEMKQLLSSLSPGTPKIIKFENYPQLLMVPLYKNDEFYDFMYLDYKTGVVFSWPTKIIEEKRFFKPTPSEWNDYSTDNITFISSYFMYPSPKMQLAPFLFPCIEDDLNRRLLGLPFTQEFRKNAFLLPHCSSHFKNMHETDSQISYLNQKYKVSFKSVPGKRLTPSKCFFYSAANICDWWAEHLKLPLDPYLNLFNGNTEYGLNPRIIESLYFKNSEKNPAFYSTIKSLLFKDAVTGEPLCNNLEAVCKIISDCGTGSVSDPVLPKQRYTFSDSLFALDKKYVKIAEYGYDAENSMKQALHTDGPLLAGLFHTYMGMPLNLPTHAVMVCGYVNTTFGTLFIYKEPYGDFPADYGSQENGDVSFRMLPSQFFFQIYSFPHTLHPVMKKKSGNIAVQFFSKVKTVIPVNTFSVSDIQGTPVTSEYFSGSYVFSAGRMPVKITWYADFFGGTGELAVKP